MSMLGNYYGYVNLITVDGAVYLTLDDYSGKKGIKLTAHEAELASQLFGSIGDREPESVETEQEREAEQQRQATVDRLRAEGKLKSYDPAEQWDAVKKSFTSSEGAGFGLPQIKAETPQSVLDEIAGKPTAKD